MFGKYFYNKNIRNIVILFDGIVKGKAGKIGEVLDSIVIDNNFHN